MYNIQMSDDFQMPPEARAYQAFIDWLNQGRQVWTLFEQVGTPIPPTLKAALEANIKQGERSRVTPPAKPDVPPQVKNDWLWVPAKDAMLRTLVLAILNEGKPLPPKEIVQRVRQILPQQNQGSIFNLTSHLASKITRQEGLWVLKTGEKAPVLYKGHIWGPSDVFQNQDVAAFRRMAVKHLLRISSDGMQTTQIYKLLKDGADWLHTEFSADMIKMDLEWLDAHNEVKLTGGASRKWVLRENANES